MPDDVFRWRLGTRNSDAKTASEVVPPGCEPGWLLALISSTKQYRYTVRPEALPSSPFVRCRMNAPPSRDRRKRIAGSRRHARIA